MPLARKPSADIGRTLNLHALLTVAVGVLALAIRLWGLEGQSVTMDEVTELAFAKQSIPAIVGAQDGFPPLYHLLLKGWLAVLGPETARWFSVLCGMLLIGVVWRIGRMVGGSATAWAAALLTAISPIHVWYAQEARANALFYLCAVLTVWLFSRAMLENRQRDWAWYGLSAIAGLYAAPLPSSSPVFATSGYMTGVVAYLPGEGLAAAPAAQSASRRTSNSGTGCDPSRGPGGSAVLADLRSAMGRRSGRPAARRATNLRKAAAHCRIAGSGAVRRSRVVMARCVPVRGGDRRPADMWSAGSILAAAQTSLPPSGYCSDSFS